MDNKKKIKIGYVLKGYVVFAIICSVLFLGLCVGLIFINTLAAIIAFIVLAVMTCAAFFYFRYNNKRLSEALLKFARSYESLEREMIAEFPIPYAITDSRGNILIYNDKFGRLYDDSQGQDNLCELFKELEPEDLEFDGKSRSIAVFYDNRNYRLQLKKIVVERSLLEEKHLVLPKGDMFVYTVYLFDETEITNMVKKSVEEQMVVSLVYIDNYEETLEQATDVKKSLIVAMVDRAVSTYFQKIGGIVRKMEKDRYFIAIKRKYLGNLQSDKFSVLDEVKRIDTGSEVPITISIGLGVGDDYANNNENARMALELALGRGGDQAVIRDGERVYYYGGKTKQAEKNSKVRARIKSIALREALINKDRVVIMGHKNCDIDSFGAAMGIYRAARTLGKKAYVVLNRNTNTVHPVLPGYFEDPEYKDVFIYPDVAASYVNNSTAVIVVDVNKADFFEVPELIYDTSSVIVIDHHLQSGDKIDNLVLMHHEPTASSTSEMVAEILQYIADNIKLKKIEAESLYAGILIDTNYFAKNTGVRTFEAAAFLKKSGVDVAKVNRLFNDSMDEVIAKAEAIRTTEVIDGKYAVALCPPFEVENPSIIAAQVANDLLDVQGIVGSFVLVDFAGKVYISARSTGDVNVQLVMERMGGGGHMNTAGAQIVGASPEDVKKKVKITIKKMIEEGIL